MEVDDIIVAHMGPPDIVGIDVGKKGGICVGKNKPSAIPLPLTKSGLVDVNLIIGYIFEVTGGVDFVLYIEDVHAMPKQGVVSMFNFGKGFGQLISLGQLIAREWTTVTPQTWKKQVLNGYDVRDKKAAIDYVKKKYKMDLVPKRCRKEHDGMADAVCIWEYGKNIYDMMNGDKVCQSEQLN